MMLENETEVRMLSTTLKNGGSYQIVFTKEIDEDDLLHIEELTALFVKTWRRIAKSREVVDGTN